MLAKYATIVRRAGALTAVAAAIMVAVSAALVGVKGLIGALIGVALVTVFFGISVLVVGRAARVSPQAMMVAAMVTYVVKIVLLAVVVSSLNGTTAFSTRTLGFVAIGCILVWSATQVITTMKLKMLYVEPEQRGGGDDQPGRRRSRRNQPENGRGARPGRGPERRLDGVQLPALRDGRLRRYRLADRPGRSRSAPLPGRHAGRPGHLDRLHHLPVRRAGSQDAARDQRKSTKEMIGDR